MTHYDQQMQEVNILLKKMAAILPEGCKIGISFDYSGRILIHTGATFNSGDKIVPYVDEHNLDLSKYIDPNRDVIPQSEVIESVENQELRNKGK